MKTKQSVLMLLVAVLLLISSGMSAQSTFKLTKEGVGCLKKGMLYSKIPAKCEGLYDRFQKQVVEDEMDGNYTVYTFYAGKQKVAVITDYGYEKTVSGITVYSPAISTPEGVHPGMTIKKLLTIPGVKGNYNDGFKLELKNYFIDFDTMSAAGTKAFNDAYLKGTVMKLSPSYFNNTSKVVSISI